MSAPVDCDHWARLPRLERLSLRIVNDEGIHLSMNPMKRCPGCGGVFDMFEEGQLGFGVDELGVFLEHMPCGHKGRPGDGPHQPIEDA